MKYFYLVLICLFLSGCTHAKAANKEYERQDKVKATLDKGINLYEKEDKEKFLGYISQNYYPNYKELKEDIEDFFYKNDQINIDYHIEKMLTSGNTESVEVKWYKNYVDKTGVLNKVSGFTTFIYDLSGDRPALVNIKGDNIFTD